MLVQIIGTKLWVRRKVKLRHNGLHEFLRCAERETSETQAGLMFRTRTHWKSDVTEFHFETGSTVRVHTQTHTVAGPVCPFSWPFDFRFQSPVSSYWNLYLKMPVCALFCFVCIFGVDFSLPLDNYASSFFFPPKLILASRKKNLLGCFKYQLCSLSHPLLILWGILRIWMERSSFSFYRYQRL